MSQLSDLLFCNFIFEAQDTRKKHCKNKEEAKVDTVFDWVTSRITAGKFGIIKNKMIFSERSYLCFFFIIMCKLFIRLNGFNVRIKS